MHLVLIEEDGPSSPTVRASTDRELSLLLQNLHRAIDATSKGAAYSVSSAVHPSSELALTLKAYYIHSTLHWFGSPDDEFIR